MNQFPTISDVRKTRVGDRLYYRPSPHEHTQPASIFEEKPIKRGTTIKVNHLGEELTVEIGNHNSFLPERDFIVVLDLLSESRKHPEIVKARVFLPPRTHSQYKSAWIAPSEEIPVVEGSFGTVVAFLHSANIRWNVNYLFTSSEFDLENSSNMAEKVIW